MSVLQFTEDVSTVKLSGPSRISANMPLILKADQYFTGNRNEYYVSGVSSFNYRFTRKTTHF